MAVYESIEDVDHAIARLQKEGWSRNAIHEELERTGLTYDQATDALDGVPFSLDPPSTSEPALVGLGGWLVLPTIGFVLGPIWAVVGLADLFSTLDSIQLEDLEMLHPGVKTLVTAEVVLSLVLVAFMLVTAVLFFRTKRAAPLAVVVLLGLRAVFSIVDVIWAAAVLPGGAVDSRMLWGNVLAALLWIPYFLFSKRVKNTFVH